MSALRAVLFAILIPLLGCETPETARVTIAGEPFDLELALDSKTRHRGLGGRSHIARNGGMIFVFRNTGPMAVVMRDCEVPIDVAFVTADGLVDAVHPMPIEPPRRADETPYAYEKRLPLYRSRSPVRFIIETAGGRLAELGLRPGQRVELDSESLIARVR